MEKPRLNIAIEKRELAKLTPLANNAHYMDKKEFDILVDNIRQDGCLTSLPVVYDKDVPGEIISGNHRVKAAIKAGIIEAECLVIKSKLTHSQKMGIQLSHNKIHGKDDPNLLKELYDSISNLDFKVYTGLSDDDFKIQEIELKPLNFENSKFENINLIFLEATKEEFMKNLEKIEAFAKKQTVLVADMKDFDALCEAVFKIQTKYNIINTALVVHEMTKLALEKINEDISNEERDEEGST